VAGSVHPIGIDLGTTQSVVAQVAADGDSVILRNSEGDILTPSVVAFEDGHAVVGKAAWEAGSKSINRIAECAKRDMGQEFYHRSIGDRKFPPEAIQGFILHKLRTDIVAELGENFQAVIAVPAYFDELRRQATFNAGQVSGLDVIDIVNEPTAAALAFGQDLGYLNPSGKAREKMHVLVYDLGGGTFDVTVIRLEDNQITTLATNGDVRLGGYDWDLRLVEHLKTTFQEKHPETPPFNDQSDFLLRRAAEQAKHILSKKPSTEIRFEHAGRSVRLEVSRREFEELTSDLLERTVFTTREVLRESSLNWSNIDRILLVGGSTRMPMVRQMIAELSGITPDTTVNPDEAVARGAAIFAHTKLAEQGSIVAEKKLRIIDVTSHSLGIVGIGEQTLRKENFRLIPRNCPLPKEVHREFVTKEDDQQNVLVQLLEGESRQPEHCIELGRVNINNIPPGLPKGTKIQVVYRYSRSGRLSVSAQIPEVGSTAKIEVQRENAMPSARLHRWKTIICSDGGYGRFENLDELVNDLLSDTSILPLPDIAKPFKPQADEPRVIQPITLKPAIPEGAPAVAADTLVKEVAKRRKPSLASDFANRSKKRRAASIQHFIGYVVTAPVGLVAGYYLLKWINPVIAEQLRKAVMD